MKKLLPIFNISTKQHGNRSIETIAFEMPPFTNSVIIIYVALFILVFIYIHKKCPYIIQINFTLCAVSYLLKFLPQFEDKNIKLVEDIFGGNLSSGVRAIFYWMSLLKQNTKFVFSTFALSLIIRIWWCRKLSIVKDVSDIGCEHLKDIARKRNKRVNELVKETFRFKTNLKVPPVFPNGWIPILESKCLKVREVKPVFALGQSFAVFRGENGNAFILNAICPHLGANIAIGGEVKGNCVECPFHKWTFNGEDGLCVKVPYSEKNAPVSGKTKVWSSCEKNGFIYVWYHAENEPPSWDVPPVTEIEDGSWHFSGKTEHNILCHIQEIPENAADMSHFQMLHSDPIFNLLGYLHKKPWLLMHNWKATWKPCLEKDQTHMTTMTLSHVTHLFNVPLFFTRMDIDVQQIGPAIVYLRFHTVFGNGIFVQNVIPEQPLQQRVIHHMYTEFKFPQWFANVVIFAENDMISRDVEMWNNKRFLKNPTLLKEDKLINTFRRWYAQFYSENSPTLESIRQDSLDW